MCTHYACYVVSTKKKSSNNNSTFSSIEFCFIAQMLPKMVSTGWQMFLELLHFFHLHKKNTLLNSFLTWLTRPHVENINLLNSIVAQNFLHQCGPGFTISYLNQNQEMNELTSQKFTTWSSLWQAVNIKAKLEDRRPTWTCGIRNINQENKVDKNEMFRRKTQPYSRACETYTTWKCNKVINNMQTIITQGSHELREPLWTLDKAMDFLEDVIETLLQASMSS